MIVAIILAGGVGNRFGSKIPKQFMSLNGKPVIQYVIDAIQESKVIDRIVIVADKKFENMINKGYRVEPGQDRLESVRNGLRGAKIYMPKYVLFFDGNRPMTTPEHIRKVVKELKNGEKAVVTSNKITDALGKVKEEYVNESLTRDNYRLIQTPEGYEWNTIWKSYFTIKKAVDGNAIAGLVKGKVKYVDIEDSNIKITYKRDLARVEQLIKYKEVTIRVPDVNRKRILVLGGSGGIGGAVVKELKTLGAFVVTPSHKEVDLSKDFSEQLIGLAEFDCIVNCSGAYDKDENLTVEKMKYMYDVNVTACALLLKLAPRVTKNLILISSTAASFGREGIGFYSATKSAVNALVEANYRKLDKAGVKVNVVCPANVNTKLQIVFNPTKDTSKMMQPEEIAKVIVGYCDVEFTGHIVYVKEGERRDR